MMRLFDAHADTPYELWSRKEHFAQNTCHIDREKASVFDQYTQVFAFCSMVGLSCEMTEKDFVECLAYFRREIEGEKWLRAYLSIEGAEVIGCDPERLGELDNFVLSTLTWNKDNALAGWHKSDKGLTEQGKAYVQAAREAGILLDVSHLSEVAFWDLMKVTQAPVIASHSNCRALWDHSRNLTDDQLRALAETGGLVGLNLYVHFLGKTANFETLRRHLEHMLSVCGEKHVCLGGDLDGCEVLPEGFVNVASYADFYRYLQGCGYGEALLDDIFYGNMSRLIEGGR